MATDSQAGGSAGGFLGLSLLLSFRRNQVASTDSIDQPPNNTISNSHDHHDGELVGRFQSHVARLLRSLLPSDSDSDSDSPLLSLPFLSKLLDVVVSCDREFYHLLLLLNPSSSSSKPAAEFLDRSVRALDLCNAASAALLSLRHWRLQADVAASAAALRRRRALRRALSKLFSAAAAAADPPGGSGARSASARFLSKNWSGGGGGAAAAPGGMAAAAGTMSCLLAFAAWALAAAVPFLDRPAAQPPLPPRQTQWAAAMAALQERIAEECSQRRRGGGLGVLAEVRAVETRARCLTELLDKEGAPADDELSAKAAELAEACRALEDGTAPLELQVRAVFHRVAATRAEVVRRLDRSSRCSAPTAVASSSSSSSSSSSPSPSPSYSC